MRKRQDLGMDEIVSWIEDWIEGWIDGWIDESVAMVVDWLIVEEIGQIMEVWWMVVAAVVFVAVVDVDWDVSWDELEWVAQENEG